MTTASLPEGSAIPGPGQTAYGEDAPRVPDDRLPMVLVLLDGLGDRPHAVLGGQTPSEAATTPVLDALAQRGLCGVHIPMGPGRAPSSEVAHWAMFGMGDVPFCGRAILEARGHELEPPAGSLVLYTSLRPSTVHDGAIWVTGRTPAAAQYDADALLAEVTSATIDGFDFTLHPLGRGEGILVVEGLVGAITDTDPFFEHLHPYAAPLGLFEAGHAGERTAAAVATYLGRVRTHLLAHPLNTKRQADELPALDVLTTKWAGVVADQPSFEGCVGVAGAMIPTSAFYRGLCRTLGMREASSHPGPDHGDAMAANLTTALGLIGEGSAFVHVHTKATDLAGHTKDPTQKVRAIETLDTALAALLEPPFTDMVVVVTGDHATPSSHGVLHTGDPTPFVATAPWLRPDPVQAFGEWTCIEGHLGQVGAADVLPLMAGYANRPRFLGSRPTRHRTIAVPDEVAPFPLD